MPSEHFRSLSARTKNQEPRVKRQDIEVLHSKSDLSGKNTAKASVNNKPNRALVENPKAKELRGKSKSSSDKKQGASRSKSNNSNFSKTRKK